MIEKRKREELYDKFRQGAVPSGADFADFIRSQLNLLDDGIDISEDPDDPICFRAHGEDENLLDFSDPDNRRRWRISGRCEDGTKEGFNIKADENSKLYVERETGNIGVGTDKPGAKLHVIQTSATDILRIDDEGSDRTPFMITSTGQVGIGLENPGAKLHVSYSGSGDILRVDDVDEDTTPFVIDDTGNTGFGYSAPAAKLTVSGGVAIGKNFNPGNKNLYVAGDIEVGGNVVFSGGAGVGGIEINAPLTSKTNEVTIKDNLRIIPDPEQTGSDGNLSVAADTTLGTYQKVYANQNVVTVNGRIRSGGDLITGEEQYELEVNDIFTIDRNPQTPSVTVEGDLTVLGTSTLGNNQAEDFILLNGTVKREGSLGVTIDDNLTVSGVSSLHDVTVGNNLSVSKTSSLYDVTVGNNLTVSKTSNLHNVTVGNNLTVGTNLTVSGGSDLHDVEVSNNLTISNNLTVSNNSTLNTAVINNLRLRNSATVNEISTDNGLSGNSNSVIPTERAVKGYVDSRVNSIEIVYA